MAPRPRPVVAMLIVLCLLAALPAMATLPTVHVTYHAALADGAFPASLVAKATVTWMSVADPAVLTRPQTAVYDAATGTATWTLPANCQAYFECLSVPLSGVYAVGTADFLLNDVTPVSAPAETPAWAADVVKHSGNTADVDLGAFDLSASTLNFNAVAAPTSSGVTVSAVPGGPLSGYTRWFLSYTTASGETEAGFIAYIVLPAGSSALLSGLPIGGTGITGRKLYRIKTGTYYPSYLVADIGNTATTYTDSTADGSLGAVSQAYNSTGGIISAGGHPLLALTGAPSPWLTALGPFDLAPFTTALLPAPTEGRLVYDSTAKAVKAYQNGAWVALGSPDLSGYMPLAGGTFKGLLGLAPYTTSAPPTMTGLGQLWYNTTNDSVYVSTPGSPYYKNQIASVDYVNGATVSNSNQLEGHAASYFQVAGSYLIDETDPAFSSWLSATPPVWGASAVDNTLTRSGAGTYASPYGLGLNLGHTNAWTGSQRNTRDGEIVAAIMASINDRSYRFAIVTTTIAAALAAITDASPAKRYALLVPNGTYAEEIQCKDWVDIIGASRSGAIITSTSQTADTVVMGGKNCRLANLTIRHTTNLGETQKYPVHCDGSTSTMMTVGVIVNCTVEALGANPKSTIGIGLWGAQRLYLVDSSFTTTLASGDAIYAHNQSGAQATPSEFYVINCAASGGAYGLEYQNIGAQVSDWMAVLGGTFSGSTNDIAVRNVLAGAGESYCYISSEVSAPSISLVDPTKRLSTMLVATIPPASQGQRPQWGAVWADSNTMYLTDLTQNTWGVRSGSIYPISAEAAVYVTTNKKASVVAYGTDGISLYANNTAAFYHDGVYGVFPKPTTFQGAVTAPSVSCSPTITLGTSAPSTTPAKPGDVFVDTTGKKLYFATGTSSSADWTIAN